LIVESAALAAILFFGIRRLPNLIRRLASTIDLLRRETFSGSIIAVAWTTMAVLVAVSWLSADYLPVAYPWRGPATGGLYQTMGSDAISPLNASALFYHTTRFGLGTHACGFGLLAHMAVGLSTYALARRYAWQPMSLTVTLLVLSMPRLVFFGAPAHGRAGFHYRGRLLHGADLSLGGTAPVRGPAFFYPLPPVFHLWKSSQYCPGSGDGIADDSGHDSPARMVAVAGADGGQAAVHRACPFAGPGIGADPHFRIEHGQCSPAFFSSASTPRNRCSVCWCGWWDWI